MLMPATQRREPPAAPGRLAAMWHSAHQINLSASNSPFKYA
jgi:hypothetical protein